MPILNRQQKAFLAWYESASHEVRSGLQLGRRTRRGWELSFASSNALQGYLGWDLMVSADLDGQWWDGVYCMDFPRTRRRGAGFACIDCVDPPGETFPTKRALWDHDFDLLGKWITTNLHTATDLAFLQSESGGVTWAELIGPPPNRPSSQADQHRSSRCPCVINQECARTKIYTKKGSQMFEQMCEQSVSLWLTRNRGFFVNPQFGLGPTGEWACFDLLALDFPNRTIWAVEVTTDPGAQDIKKKAETFDTLFVPKIREVLSNRGADLASISES